MKPEQESVIVFNYGRLFFLCILLNHFVLFIIISADTAEFVHLIEDIR